MWHIQSRFEVSVLESYEMFSRVLDVCEKHFTIYLHLEDFKIQEDWKTA